MNSWTGKPELTNAESIFNDGFWLDLDIAEFMAWMRIPSELDNDTIKRELINAVIEINRQLLPVKTEILAMPYTSLESYCLANSQEIGGQEVLFTKYQDAVFSYAKACMLQQLPTLVRRELAENVAQDSKETRVNWMDRSMQCVLYFFNAFSVDSSTLTSIGDVYVGAV